MGLASADLSIARDMAGRYMASGALASISSPRETRLVPSKEEIEQSLGIYEGSGGNVLGFFDITIRRVPISGGSNIPAKLESPANKLSMTIQRICTAFGVTKDELAKICKIDSRKTLYNWIDGKSKPRRSAMERLFDLALIAQAWKQAALPNDRESMYRPILGNMSVFDLLTSDKLDREAILFAGSRIALSSTRQTLSDPFA